jgi:hypothetical protein
MANDPLKMKIKELSELLYDAEVVMHNPTSHKEKKQATKTHTSIVKALAKFDEAWMNRLIKTIEAAEAELQLDEPHHFKEVLTNGIVAIRLIQATMKTGQVGRLLDVMHEVFLKTRDNSEYAVRTLLGWLACNQEFSNAFLELCTNDETRANKFKLMCYDWYRIGSNIQLVHEQGRYWLDHNRNMLWCVPARWSIQAHNLVYAVEQCRRAIDCAVKSAEQLEPDWELADIVWQFIKDDSCCCLHEDGDAITINVPELNNQFINCVTLKPGANFPDAEAVFTGTLFGEVAGFTSPLQNGRIVDAHSGSEANDWLLTMVTLKAYWMITTQQSGNCNAVSSRTPGKQLEYERRKARAHFMRLPEGHQAREGAIANAIKYVGRKPREGFTFWAPRPDGNETVHVIRNVLTITSQDLAEFIPAKTAVVGN